ncbi:MAG: acetoin utilization protein AcuC, partial [Thermoleophilia bacterium]|nr:acetoin utilization protein AcuC [Thermoleophilia bacterium]
MQEPESILIVYGPELATYRFSDEHPLQPARYQLTMALLESLGWLNRAGVFVEAPRPATVSELLTVHSYSYIQAVEFAQKIAREEGSFVDLRTFGLGTEDNPLFPDVHDAPVLYTGASLQAMQALLADRAIHAYNPAGGLHHAQRSRAAGFCIYNDCAAAIAAAAAAGRRVAYVDLDAHHGDGVQNAFYENPRVLTISIHESGRFLFPGTGDVDEIGRGEGWGTCINVPLPALAGNEAIRQAVERLVVPAVRLFRPDILVTQTGCDALHSDPLTDLTATLPLFPELAHTL